MENFNLIGLIKEYGLAKALHILKIIRIQKKIHRFGGMAVLLHTCPTISYSYVIAPHNEEEKEYAEKMMSKLIINSIESDKYIHDILFKGLADYLRPLTVDKKIFLDMLNETTN